MSWVGSWLGGTTIETTVSVAEPTTPVVSPYTPDEPEYVDHTTAAINRLSEQFKAKTS